MARWSMSWARYCTSRWPPGSAKTRHPPRAVGEEQLAHADVEGDGGLLQEHVPAAQAVRAACITPLSAGCNAGGTMSSERDSSAGEFAGTSRRWSGS